MVVIVKRTMTSIHYYLTSHPTIVNFRWSHSESWGSTWSFLFTSIFLYLSLSATLHILLSSLLRNRHRPVPLGPVPAIHSLAVSLTSLTIFTGLLLSTAAEISETRWLFGRGSIKTTPFQWLLCFPIGTRPSGRVFFWSYLYYLSRFLHMARTVITVLSRRRLSAFQLTSNAFLALTAFVWLEFSQSFQVIGILLATLVNGVVYGYRFWTAAGLPGGDCGFPFVARCQAVLLGSNLVCHVGVLALHLCKAGGCNGIGAWVFNSFLNGAILLLFVDFYVRVGRGQIRQIAKDI